MRRLFLAGLMVLVLGACASGGNVPAKNAQDLAALLRILPPEAQAARDYATLVRFLRPVADQGNAVAQFYLASFYGSGQGVPLDDAETVKWLRKSADQGYDQAQETLGLLYHEGRGVPLDDAEAARWLRKAADQGDASARRNLTLLLASGNGVPPDNARHNARPLETPRPSPREMQAKVGIPPIITVSSSVQTHDNTVDIIGTVASSGNAVSLKVDGRDAPIHDDGSFSFRRAVLVGTSEIKLSATNEWAQSAEATIKVTRIPVSTETKFPLLAADRLQGKPRPHAITLIIGIEQYKSVPPAEFAENDARSFYDYATNALGVPASRVKLLTGADAQRVDVEAAILTWLKPQVVKGQTEVFVFFSGHGLASDDGKDLYLLPQDGNRALLDRSALRRKELIDMIVDSGPKSATLFLDTCYSGGTRGKDSLVASARPILVAAKEQAVPPNVTILAAAGNDQLSSSLESAKHGLFSYFLMKGLEGDAAGSDHVITAAKLEAYLADHIPLEAAKLGRTQTPQLIGDGGRVI